MPQWLAVVSSCKGSPDTPLLRKQTGAVPVPPIILCPFSPHCLHQFAVGVRKLLQPRPSNPSFLPDTVTPQDSALAPYKLPLGNHSITCKHCHPRRIHFGGGRPGSIQLLRHKKGYTIHPTRPQRPKQSPMPSSREPTTLCSPTSCHTVGTPYQPTQENSLPRSWLWSDHSTLPRSQKQVRHLVFPPNKIQTPET